MPTGIAGMIVQGSDPVCGFCCCHAEGISVRDKTLPVAFTDLYSQVNHSGHGCTRSETEWNRAALTGPIRCNSDS